MPRQSVGTENTQSYAKNQQTNHQFYDKKRRHIQIAVRRSNSQKLLNARFLFLDRWHQYRIYQRENVHKPQYNHWNGHIGVFEKLLYIRWHLADFHIRPEVTGSIFGQRLIDSHLKGNETGLQVTIVASPSRIKVVVPIDLIGKEFIVNTQDGVVECV